MNNAYSALVAAVVVAACTDVASPRATGPVAAARNAHNPLYLCATKVTIGAGGPDTTFAGRTIIIVGGTGDGCVPQLSFKHLTIR